MDKLKFSTNWNRRPGNTHGGKLDCRAFTTLRLSDRLNIGDKVAIWLNDDCLGVAMVEDKKTFFLSQLSAGMSFLDTGYSPEETGNILKSMYPREDFSTKKVTWYLLAYVQEAGGV